MMSVTSRILRAKEMRKPHTCFARLFLGLGHELHMYALMMCQLSTAGRAIGEHRSALVQITICRIML